MTWDCLSFNKLSPEELYAILRLRQEVFIVEQTCYYLDADGKDQEAYHIRGIQNGKLMAYARLLPLGSAYSDYVSIGRIITSKEARGSGAGKKLMEYSIVKTHELWPETKIKISAQSYLETFYQNFGFINTGEHYLEDGIPHQAMVL